MAAPPSGRTREPPAAVMSWLAEAAPRPGPAMAWPRVGGPPAEARARTIDRPRTVQRIGENPSQGGRCRASAEATLVRPAVGRKPRQAPTGKASEKVEVPGVGPDRGCPEPEGEKGPVGPCHLSGAFANVRGSRSHGRPGAPGCHAVVARDCHGSGWRP